MKTVADYSRRPLHHLCKLSHDGSILFYEIVDFLVFTTIVFAYAALYGIVVTEVCIMLNHFHIAAYGQEDNIGLFYKCVCSRFSWYYNKREGKVKCKWSEGPNISKKWTAKNKKALYIYIGNNFPEKKGCSKAIEYRWNFLERGTSGKTGADSPVNNKSAELQLAEAIARDAYKGHKPLTYTYFEHNIETLIPKEWQALTEYVLNLYVDIDYDDISQLFNSFDTFLEAAAIVSGSDYEVNDDFAKENYRHYTEMNRIMSERGLCGNDAIIHNQEFNLFELIQTLAFQTKSTNIEISRFLHIPIEKVQIYTGRRF